MSYRNHTQTGGHINKFLSTGEHKTLILGKNTHFNTLNYKSYQILPISIKKCNFKCIFLELEVLKKSFCGDSLLIFHLFYIRDSNKGKNLIHLCKYFIKGKNIKAKYIIYI